MKKISQFLLSFLLCFAISSCGSLNNNESNHDSGDGNSQNLRLYNYDEISQGQTVDGAYEQFVNINVLSSYLGYGYDVVNDPYMDKDYINMSAPILDTNKIRKAKLRMIKEYKANSYSYEGSDMEEIIDKYSASFNVNIGVGSGKSKVFSGGFKTTFKGSSETKTYLKFYKNVYQVKTFNLYLTDSLSTIQSYLSDDFINDTKTMTAKALFNKYGTHLIREVAMGGRLELNSVWSSTKAGYSDQIESDVNAQIKALSIVDIDAKLSMDYTSKLNAESVKSEIEGIQVGGKLVDISTADTMAKNKTAWLESLNNDLSVSALSGIVGENSLIPLWDLIPDKNQSKREELEQVFVQECEEKYDEICNLYKLNKERNVKVIFDENQGSVLNNKSPYLDGNTVELIAKPKNGYYFEGWYKSGELVSDSDVYNFVIHVDTTLEARFTESKIEHMHTYSNEWTYDENYHWHNATCEHSSLVSDKEQHSLEESIVPPEVGANGYTLHTCTVCGYYYKDNETSLPQNKTVFEGVIRSGEYKVAGSGKTCSSSFSLGQSLAELKSEGYNNLVFTIDYQLREQDNCYIYVNLYDENNNSLYDRRVEHGGNTTDYNYQTYSLELTLSIDSLASKNYRIQFKAENALFKDFYVGTVNGIVVATY